MSISVIIGSVLYVIMPIGGLYLGYLGLKKLNKPKIISYQFKPKISHIAENSLPTEIKMKLKNINVKGEKLRLLFGDTNQDGVIDDKDTVNETYVMINKLLDEHIPQAVTDYRGLKNLGGKHTKNTNIGNSGVTGKQALLDILNTVNSQFDDLLEASYHQDGQKLLVTNRYLKQRFDSHSDKNNEL